MKKLPDRDLFQDVALETGTDPAFIEKDWFAVQLLADIQTFNTQQDIQAIFSGGTSLSKGFGLIKRFSEDLDFFLIWPGQEPSQGQRRAFRKQLLAHVTAADSWFQIQDKQVQRGDSHRFFKAPVTYPLSFEKTYLRPHLQIEMSFMVPQIAPQKRPIQSIVATLSNQPPETEILCVSPFETAADKLSALAWRVLARNRKDTGDDPTMIRHLHDLAALTDYVKDDFALFSTVAHASIARDVARRRGGDALQDISDAQRIEHALERLQQDPLYKQEYEDFVVAMSYADDYEKMGFEDAISRLEHLAAHYLNNR